MHLRGDIIYKDWREFWKNSYVSPYFKAVYDETSEQTDWSLSERQLFVQSNGRILLGQDTMGRLHFICTPHDRIYAVPSGGENICGQFGGHIGQYYQNDTALLLGKMRYELEMANGLVLSAANKNSVTAYTDHFLPTTRTSYPEAAIKVFSFAPVMEKDSAPISSIHPIPGPAAVMFCMEVANTSGCTLTGKVRLGFDQRFVNQFEHYGKRFEDYTQGPYKSEWDQKLLILWHPEACAAVQLLGGTQEGEANNPRIYCPFVLKAGESRIFTTVIALTPKRDEIHRNLGILYQHTALEWLNVTADFWKKRLGTIVSGIREDTTMGLKYSDMHIRFILDNFNCLSFNEAGDLLTNWQGAPSHSLSRLWGIDIEPDVVSVMYSVPEVGPRAIEYLLKRNTPRFSLYSDHSMFFYIAPLLIAGKYLELTGNKGYFCDNPKIVENLMRVYQGILAHKHKDYVLFSSHYASDLIVFRKYDYGCNVQCYYALKSWSMILSVTGQDNTDVKQLISQMPVDMAATMEGDGPFGKQITGGTNLGEDQDRFYIPEELFYYGGEDTATVLAPLYGLYDFDYVPYVNLHRFAKSLYITSYDPEFQTMRELHFGMNPSATGCTLRLGGSHTRQEMKETLALLYSKLDETGSLFWWPRAYNKKRCLTRCSQGQGAWIQQSVEQWFGIRLNALDHEITIMPQGLLTSYTLTDCRIGAFYFDVDYVENENETTFQVVNHNAEDFRLRFIVRGCGAGAEGNSKTMQTDSVLIPAGKKATRSYRTETLMSEEPKIEEAELRSFSENEIVFAPYGIVMPKLYSGNCNIFLLRFVAVHSGDETWENVRVKLQVPENWKASSKKFYIWDYQPVFSEETQAVNEIGDLAANTHGVGGFYISVPDELSGGENSIMLSEHPYPQNGKGKLRQVSLLIEGTTNMSLEPIRASLLRESHEVASYILPVQVLDHESYQQRFQQMYHGSCEIPVR